MISQYADRKILKIIFIVAVISAFGCHIQTEKDKIQKTITDIRSAAEEKDMKKILNSLSRTYNDPQGFSYETVRGTLQGYLFRYQKIHIYLTNLDVSAEGAAGKAVFRVILSGSSKTEPVHDVVPEALGMYSFDVSLKKEDGEWKVTSARWDKISQIRE